MLSRLFDGTTRELTRGLLYTQERHQILAQNLANAETPGYRSRDLVFDDHLRPLVRRAAPELTPASLTPGADDRRARVVYADEGPAKANGNDVSADRQMAKLAENTLFHHALTQILINRFALLKQAISGRV